MNAKTSKLIRRFSTAAGRHTKAVKRAWVKMPRHLRHEFRAAMLYDAIFTDANAKG